MYMKYQSKYRIESKHQNQTQQATFEQIAPQIKRVPSRRSGKSGLELHFSGGTERR